MKVDSQITILSFSSIPHYPPPPRCRTETNRQALIQWHLMITLIFLFFLFLTISFDRPRAIFYSSHNHLDCHLVELYTTQLDYDLMLFY